MARDNLRRVHGYDLDDLIQEGFICYHICRERYTSPYSRGYNERPRFIEGVGWERAYKLPDKPTEESQRHLTALVRTAFRNRLASLAHRHPTGVEVNASDLAADETAADAVWQASLPSEHAGAPMAILLRDVPWDIKQVLQILLNDAAEPYREWIRGRGKRMYVKRETTNDYFCRLLGLTPGYDIVGAVQKYFSDN